MGPAVSQRRDELRAADVDRTFVAELLKGAVDEGRLTLNEYDERLQRTYQARTYADLDQVIADLPRPSRRTAVTPAAATTPVPKPSGTRVPVDQASAGLSRAWHVWTVVVAVNTVIWVMVMVGNMHWVYPWPVWVAGPWGAVLLVSTVFGRRHGRR